MSKKLAATLIISIIAIVTVCFLVGKHITQLPQNGVHGETIDDDTHITMNELEIALELYGGFLHGRRTVKKGDSDVSVNDVFRFETKNDTDYNRYALYDMNGDGIPELHVSSVGPYDILTCRDSDLVIWASFWSYSKPLNNGAVLTEHLGGANDRTSYVYMVFDYYGKELLSVTFEKYNSNIDGIYDENSNFFFEDVEVSKEDWDKLTEKYLSVGIDRIQWINFTAGDEYEQDIITEDDFSFTYKNTVISDKIPFSDIAEILGFSLPFDSDDEDDNTEVRAGATVNNQSYRWYVLHYPNIENKEISLDYVINTTSQTSWLVLAGLYNVETYRGIKVGDDEEKLLQAYGRDVQPEVNRDNEVYYHYTIKGNFIDPEDKKSICFIVDTNTNKVVEITINYCSSSSLDLLEINLGY